MARAYAGAAGTHVVLGLLCMAAGVAWLCLLYFYEPLFVEDNNGSRVSLMTLIPEWVIVLLSGKIICGFWFFVTGVVGCCVSSRGCTEGIWVALNVLNVIVWTPVLLILMVGTMLILTLFPQLLQGEGFDGDFLSALVLQFVWLWVFPGVGALIGVIEFILSIVSYSIVCCCRPDSLDEGYEYQYEMK